MPVDMSRYPKNWKKIVARVARRAGGVCECTGECGTRHIGGKRRNRCDAVNYEAHPITGSKVVLTTAHLGIDHPGGRKGDKHDKMDCRMKNLKHMCQRCHLNFDRDEHKSNAMRTRRERRLKSGQLEMPL